MTVRERPLQRTAMIEIIQASPLFAGLDADALDLVARETVERRLPADEVAFEQGDDATHCIVVAVGRIRLTQTTVDGQQIVLRFMGPGDVLGCVAVFRGIPYPATATAVEPTRLLCWSAAATSDLMARLPALAGNALRIVGGRIDELQQRLREVATERVERRIARVLLRLARQAGRRGDDGVEIPFALSRQDIAEMCATTLFTVSRTLSAWEAKGLVTAGRRHVVIRDPHALVVIAEAL